MPLIISDWLTDCHFRFLTERVTFYTWDSSDIWPEWWKKTKRWKDKKIKRQKESWCRGCFVLFCSSFLHNFGRNFVQLCPWCFVLSPFCTIFAIFLHTFCTVVPLLFCSLICLHNFLHKFYTVVSLLLSLLLSRQPSGKRMLTPGGWKTHNGDGDDDTFVTMILMMTTKLLVAGITRSFQTSFWKLWKKRNLWGRRGHWVHFSLKWNASVEGNKILSRAAYGQLTGACRWW